MTSETCEFTLVTWFSPHVQPPKRKWKQTHLLPFIATQAWCISYVGILFQSTS